MIYLFLFFLELSILYYLSRRVIKVVYKLFYKLTRRETCSKYLFSIVFLPGTFIHEISHLLAAILLLVPVEKFGFLPRLVGYNTSKKNSRNRGDFVLGNVVIAKIDPVRRFLIGIAPLILGLGLIFILIYSTSMIRIIDARWRYIFLGFLIFQIANSMFSSRKDLNWLFILFILLLLLVFLLTFLRINLFATISNFKLNQNYLELLKKANIFLFVPIFMDLVVLILVGWLIGYL